MLQGTVVGNPPRSEARNLPSAASRQAVLKAQGADWAWQAEAQRLHPFSRYQATSSIVCIAHKHVIARQQKIKLHEVLK